MLSKKWWRSAYYTAILGLAGLIAYLQTSGTNHVLGALLITPSSLLEWSSALLTDESRTLTESAPRQSDAETPDQVEEPASARGCPGLVLRAISQARDPTESLASLRRPADDAFRLMRQGSRFGDFELLHIGYDAVAESPAVWLRDAAGVCQVLLFRGPAPLGSPELRAPEPQPLPEASEPLPDLPWAAVITQSSPYDFSISSELVERLYDNSLFMSVRDPGARGRLDRGSGSSPPGFVLSAVRPGGLAYALGLRNGDRVERIGDYSTATPAGLLRAYANLRRSQQIPVQLTRDGRKETLNYTIRQPSG